MKWLFPIALVVAATYMWRIDTNNSDAAFGAALVFGFVCAYLEWRKP